MNASIYKNNTSSVTGVSWHKASKKWIACISKEGVKTTLGYFLKKEDAVNARKQAQLEYFGEFSSV